MDKRTENTFTQLLGQYRDREGGPAAHPEMCADWARERVKAQMEIEKLKVENEKLRQAQSQVRSQCIAMANSLGMEINI